MRIILMRSKEYGFYQIQCRLILVNILEEKKEYDKALAQIENLEKIVSEDLIPKVLFAKGRILHAKKKQDEALSIFDSIIKEYSTSPEADKARSAKALLF